MVTSSILLALLSCLRVEMAELLDVSLTGAGKTL